MNKSTINKYLRKLGFEVHGTGYIQSMQKADFKEDVFGKQVELVSKNAKVIFDVGANRGDTSNQYSKYFPGATIYAFEPFDASYEIMISRTKHNPLIIPVKQAVAETPGTAVFHVNKNVDTNSLLASKEMGLSSDKQVATVNTVEVEKCTLDEFCAGRGITAIDILKLDIQGGELAALKGAAGLLKEKKIKLVYAETYFRQQYESQPLLPDIATYLQQFNYHIQDFYNPIYGNNSIAWCDTIFV